MERAAYSLEAIHVAEYPFRSIIRFRIPNAVGKSIIKELWPEEDFWGAPGGSSIGVESEKELKGIAQALGEGYRLVFDPALHRWRFHVHLVSESEWP